jgi:hypothetical protein
MIKYCDIVLCNKLSSESRKCLNRSIYSIKGTLWNIILPSNIYVLYIGDNTYFSFLPSGHKRGGIIHSLVVHDTVVPEYTEWRRPQMSSVLLEENRWLISVLLWSIMCHSRSGTNYLQYALVYTQQYSTGSLASVHTAVQYWQSG